MRIAIGADHAGFELKKAVIKTVQEYGHEALDLGTFSSEAVDYPDYAERVGRTIQEGKADRGILLCGSGIGVCIAANKMAGIFASVAHDPYSAAQGVEHDAMNVLCLGGRVIGSDTAKDIVIAFLDAQFTNEERHTRRVAKVKALERRK